MSMKITLYSLNDIHAEAMRLFLNKNNLNFEEIKITNEQLREELRKMSSFSFNSDVSVLKVVRNHSINVCDGFNELFLNNLLSDIKKYKIKNIQNIKSC